MLNSHCINFILIQFSLFAVVKLPSVNKLVRKPTIHAAFVNNSFLIGTLSARLESLFSARGRYFFSSSLRAWKKPPSQRFPICNGTFLQEPAHLTSVFFKFCALDWRMAVCLHAENLQRAIHTFQSGLSGGLFLRLMTIVILHGCQESKYFKHKFMIGIGEN